MQNRGARALFLAALLAGAAAAASAQDRVAGPIGEPEGPARAQLHWIPSLANGKPTGGLLQIRVCRPEKDAPAAVAVINHGSPAKATDRPNVKPGSCTSEAAEWFLKRGFAVAFPLRRGYGATGGTWAEDYGPCNQPRFVEAGLTTAEDIDSAARYVSDLPYVRPDRILIVGQSAGGWGTVAYASRNPSNVWGFINMAGGRAGWHGGQPNSNCRADLLIQAAGQLGKTARAPMLWVYTQNDTFFSPELSQKMHGAFTAAGGKADYELLGAFGSDGHGLFFGRQGSKVWERPVQKYLATLPAL